MTKAKWFLTVVFVFTFTVSPVFADPGNEITYPKIILFPNPTDDNLTFSFDHLGQDWNLDQVMIFDLLGKVKVIIYGDQFHCDFGRPESEIRYGFNFSEQLDVEDGKPLEKGIYLIQFQFSGSGGEKNLTGRVVYNP